MHWRNYRKRQVFRGRVITNRGYFGRKCEGCGKFGTEKASICVIWRHRPGLGDSGRDDGFKRPRQQHRRPLFLFLLFPPMIGNNMVHVFQTIDNFRDLADTVQRRYANFLVGCVAEMIAH